jgi:hypothetical protein
MNVEAWTNDIIGASERRLLIKDAILGFKALSWELRKSDKTNRFTNLSLLVMLHLKNNDNISRTNIMKALKSNYNDIENALNLLFDKGLILSDKVLESRFNKKIAVKSKKFRLTLKGEMLVTDFIEKLV